MSCVWLLKNLLGNLLLPPANGLLLLGLAGVFRKRRWSFGLAVFPAMLLLAQSLPIVANALISVLEQRAAPVLTGPGPAQAIVVLGSGLKIAAEEYGDDTVNERSLTRLRYGALLAHRYHLPVLASGGIPINASPHEVDVIGDVLAGEFGVEGRWRENRSRDTAENTRLSAHILRGTGIREVILVTQACHMPRARRLFESEGLAVVAAPTDIKDRRGKAPAPLEWLPQAQALHTSYYALHELLGLAWFELTLNRQTVPSIAFATGQQRKTG